jgi:hypothetical protein
MIFLIGYVFPEQILGLKPKDFRYLDDQLMVFD